VPLLTVIAGPNGSGKSTLTGALGLEHQSNLIDPDQIARRMNSADPAVATVAAGREAIARCRAYLSSQTSFAVETTLAGNGPIAMIREAKASGFSIWLLFIALNNPELNIQRVRTRVEQGGHHVRTFADGMDGAWRTRRKRSFLRMKGWSSIIPASPTNECWKSGTVKSSGARSRYLSGSPAWNGKYRLPKTLVASRRSPWTRRSGRNSKKTYLP
jgi:predicted ABC-type ATPase